MSNPFFFKYFAIFLLFTFLKKTFTIFSIFFPKKIDKLKKFETKTHVGQWGGGLIQLFNATISPNNVPFIYTREMKVNIYSYIMIYLIFCDYFQVV
jgi:hypothetical protein